MKQNGRSVLFVTHVVILCLLLAACPGFSDWEYALPNCYEIVHCNSQEVVFGKIIEGSFQRLIDRYILSFCFDERYIGLQRYPVDPDRPWEDILDIHKIDTSNPEYYLVDSATDNIFGPYAEKDYTQKLNDLGITSMCDWITTEPSPVSSASAGCN